MKIKINEIKELCIKVLKKKGLTKKQAEIIVGEYLDGELRGKQCHGFAAFPKFAVEKLKTFGKKYKILKNKDCYMLVNGNEGMGQLIMFDLLPKIIKKAKKKGIAMLGIYNMHSYLMPGTYVRKATKDNILTIACNYGGAPRICPFGSIDPVFATNPIAVGIPSTGIPIVVDMATSITAMGKVRLAKKLNKKIPAGTAIDKNGTPTTDPAKAMEGALFPFGAHKGSALALTVEILSRSMYNIQKPKGKRGFFFIFIDPVKFISINQFKKNTSQIIKKIKTSRKAKGTKEIFFPGEQDEKIKQQNLKKGYLEIDKKIIKEIEGLL